MRGRQRDIDWFENQIDVRKNDLEDLQNRLYDAEKLLVRQTDFKTSNKLEVLSMMLYYYCFY